MRSFRHLVVAWIALALLQFGAAEAKSKKPIRLVEGQTVSQQVVSTIAVRALKKAGFKSELVTMPDAEAPAALTGGSAHVHLSMPNGGAGSSLAEMLAEDRVLLLGGLRGNKPDEPVLKVVSLSLKKRWPYAQKMLKRMVLKPEVILSLAAEVEAGKPVDDAVADWWKANRKIWKPWVAASTNWMKP